MDLEEVQPVCAWQSGRDSAPGYDYADLVQEALMVALRVWDPTRPREARLRRVRAAVRAHFQQLRRRAATRAPRDSWGRRVTDRSGWTPAWFHDQVPSAEGAVEARDLVAQLRSALDRADFALLLEAYAEAGALAQARVRGWTRAQQARLPLVLAHARAILARVTHYPQEGSVADYLSAVYARVTAEETPACLPGGQDPQGYDKRDPLCHQCPDKFRCLPAALKAGLVEGSLSDDYEVEAVVTAATSAEQQDWHERAIQRMLRRQELTQAAADLGQSVVIPQGLSTRVPLKTPGEPAPEPKARAKPAKPAPKAPPKKRLKRKKPAAPKQRKPPTTARGTLKNGKPLPPIRQCTQEQLWAALKRLKVGQPFPLKPGMQLVRRRRDRPDVVVTIRENGFECDGVIYSSPSTAVMYQERRIVSANAFFHLDDHQCTEIRDHKGRTIAGACLRIEP